MKKIAVMLAGCGQMDGSEIHEATLTLLYIRKAGADWTCFALDEPQVSVVDHVTKKPVESETRNQLLEAARIARGNVKPLSELDAADFDAYIQPGGSGSLANLGGGGEKLHPLVKEKILNFYSAGKPLGFICIAPLMGAMALGDKGVRLTLGNDPDFAAKLESFGAEHKNCPVDKCVVDESHKVVSTPAYMLGPEIDDVAAGIEKLCRQVVRLAEG